MMKKKEEFDDNDDYNDDDEHRGDYHDNHSGLYQFRLISKS